MAPQRSQVITETDNIQPDISGSRDDPAPQHSARLSCAPAMIPTFTQVIQSQVETDQRAPELAQGTKEVEAHDQSSSDVSSSKPLPFTLLKPCLRNFFDELKTEDAYPPTPLQEGLIALSTKRGGAYTAQYILRLPDNVDIKKFQEAWELIVKNHEILRTRLYATEHGVVQVVGREGVEWQYSDDLEEYCMKDRQITMEVGKPLARYALVGRVFALTLHHSIYDFWSFRIICEDLERAYAGLKLTSTTPFSNFIQYLSQVDTAASATYWREQLRDVDELTAMAFPCIPKLAENIVSDCSIEHRFQIEGVKKSVWTMSTRLRLAWALVLGRRQDSSDVVFGVTLSGRNAPVAHVEDIVGPLIATIPLRIKWDPSEALSTVLHRIQVQAAEMIPFEHTGLQNISHLGPVEKAACKFQTRILVQPQEEPRKNQHPHGRELIGLKDAADIDPHSYNNALTLDFRPEGSSLNIKATFDSNILNHIEVQSLLFQVASVLQSICILEKTTSSIGEIDLACNEDRQVQYNQNTQKPLDIYSTIPIQFHDRVIELPDAPALDSWDGKFSYRQLDEMSTAISIHLVHSGVLPHSYVPFCFEKSSWAVISILGIMKAAAICVPIDPISYSETQITKILEDVGAHTICCSPQYRQRFSTRKYSVITVDQCLLNSLSPDNQHNGERDLKSDLLSPEDLAYIIPTSGSTGDSKLIMLEHRGLCISAMGNGDIMAVGPGSRIFQFSAYVYDVSIADIAIALTRGACLCIPSESDRLNNLAGSINSFRANRIWLTPTVAGLLSPDECPSLEMLSIGGEALTDYCKLKWLSRATLINWYGPAEVSNIGTAVVVTKDVPASMLGHANGTKLWVTEPGNHEKLTPLGCIGEIIFEGPNVARGYLHSVKVSGFIKCPTWRSRLDTQLAVQTNGASLGKYSGSQSRFYKTGDLARLNSDGTITFIGRKDLTIKLRGQRIELSQLESAIISCLPPTAEVIADVVCPIDSQNQPVLVAFIYLPPENGYDIGRTKDDDILASAGTLVEVLDSMRESISKNLPVYMMPTVWIPLARMPKLVSGKSNRKILRKLALNMTAKTMNSMAIKETTTKRMPTNSVQFSMQELWADILHLPRESVGIDDSWFHLGGDSIKSIMLVAAAKLKGFNLNVSMIFQSPILYKLCSLIANDTDDNSTFSAPFHNLEFSEVAKQCQIMPSMIEEIYPCTPLQEGLMLSSFQHPTAYIARRILRLSANTSIRAFRKAWQSIIDEIPILRTRIIQPARQVVIRKETFSWNAGEELDLKSYLAIDNAQSMTYGAPLNRYVVLQNDRVFVWTVHHALYDGWSIDLILDRLTHLYEAHCDFEKSSPKVAWKPTPFKIFIEHIGQRHKTVSDEFWLSQFSGCNASVFPTLPSPSYSPLTNASIEHKFAFSRTKIASNITTSSLLRAAWSLVVASYSGTSDDVVFGATLNGRNVPLDGIMEVIGPTLTTVPVRVKIDWTKRVSDYLDQIQEQYVQIIPFEHDGVQSIKHVSAEASSACGFQTILSIQAKNDKDILKDKQPIWQDETSSTMGFHTRAIVIQCEVSEESISVVADYDSIIDVYQMQRILYSFAHITTQLSLEGAGKLSDISLLSLSDLTTVLEWNNDLPNKVNDCIHRKFKKRAKLSPKAEAICAWDGSFTYKELDEKSDVLAVHLRSLGVGPEVFVPFCFEKTRWTLVAILGILKASGACVPLDPSQPLQRLQGIIAELGCRVIASSLQHENLFSTVQHVVTVSEEQEYFHKYTGPLEIKLTDADVQPANACYAIYTSGSTGTAKGVVWEHATLCTSIQEHGNAFNFGPSSRVLQFASHSFDVSVSELLTTLLFGGCVCIPSDAERMGDIAEVITKMRINWSFFTPSYARLLDPAKIPGLKTIVLGGEAPGQDNIARWAGRTDLQLIVTYGPAESCIYCAKNAVSDPRSEVSIGRSIGGVMWIADAKDITRLAPIGSVGEIVVEGHILAREYLHDQKKTAAAFMPLPASWQVSRQEKTFIYRTGDLGRYNSDGTIVCCGRKDYQRKIHGQRIELAEVEFHVGLAAHARQVMAMIPTEGLCKDRLLVVISVLDSEEQSLDLLPPSPQKIRGQQNNNLSSPSIELLDEGVAASRIAHLITEMQDQVSLSLPVYMVPSIWVLVRGIPLMPASGKLNRPFVQGWIDSISHERYLRVLELSASSLDGTVSTMSEMERKLQDIWSHVLNVPAKNIGLKVSFIRLGGDSISAMQVMTLCRAQGLLLTMQDILKHGTISRIAPHIQLLADEGTQRLEAYDEEVEVPFGLSPFQNLFMHQVSEGSYNHFNQSFLFELNVGISTTKLQSALDLILKRHGMLRARFRLDKTTSKWHQFISKDATNLKIRRRSLSHMEEAALLAKEIEVSLDIQNGPVVAADLYDMSGGGTLLFMCIHHLVIDLVSWRIILQDLEDLLMRDNMSITERSLPFRTWCQRIETEVKANSGAKSLLYEVPRADYEYWGVDKERGNPYKDEVEKSFTLDEETTKKLFGDSNHLLDTEPLDLLLSAALYSFHKTFPDRRGSVPIYNEGHGRDQWLPGIDSSSTVGWFTTLCPIIIPNHTQSLFETVREMKDVRRRIPANGVPYFSSLLASSSEAQDFPGFEIVLNYSGLYQQLERKTSAMKVKTWPPSLQPRDADPDIQRFSLFTISASVKDSSLVITVAFSAKMCHQNSIHRWVDEMQMLFQSMTKLLLSRSTREYTLSDFPDLPITYAGLETLLKDRLPALDISPEQIENIYPVSHMMQGILISQAKSPALYHVKHVWEVLPSPALASSPESLDRLVKAWQLVVDRHHVLRTVLIDGVSVSSGESTTLYHQIILKHVSAPIQVQDRRKPIEYVSTNNGGGKTLPLYYNIVITIDESSRVFMELAISHAITDGTSQRILVEDLATAYDSGDLHLLPSDSYGEYIRCLQQTPRDTSIGYWKEYLRDCQVCFFPELNKLSRPNKEGHRFQKPCEHTVEFLASSRLYEICASRDITPATIFQAAWALVLGCYSGTTDPCFGFLSSGRDLPIRNIEAAVGPFINMLIRKVSLENKSTPLLKLLQKMQEDLVSSLAHQASPLAEIHRAIDLDEGSLFNTIVSVQAIKKTRNRQSGLILHSISSEDPTEYGIVLNIGTCRETTEVTFVYQQGLISDTQINVVAKTFLKVIMNIMTSIDGVLGDIDLLTELDNQQIADWNRNPIRKSNLRLDCLIQQQVLSSGSAKAIDAWDGCMTYTELDQAATIFGRYLFKHFIVGAEILVPICFEKSLWAIVAMLGVLKSGSAFVPLNPSDPVERLRELVSQIKGTFVIGGRQTREKIRSLAGTNHAFVVLDSHLLSNDSISIPINDIEISGKDNLFGPSDLAYVLFTSGSSGVPKGVMVDHEAISTSISIHGKAFGMNATTRCLQFASYTFDVSLSEIFATLNHGGCIFIPSEAVRANVDDLEMFIRDSDINWAFLTPTIVRLLKPSGIPSLQTLCLTGEAYGSDNLATWLSKVRLLNCYGPTECSVFATACELLSLEDDTIGRAIGCTSWIVDPLNSDRLVPVGAVGELLLEGPIQARGYLNDSEKTRAAFVVPSWHMGDKRLYKTGDLVRYLQDGSLQYLGRNDGMEKLRGQRIEVGEIEHQLLKDEEIDHCVVSLARNGLCKDNLVVVFTLCGTSRSEYPQNTDEKRRSQIHLVRDPSLTTKVSAIRDRLEEKLPTYMVPSIWLPVQSIPMLSSGKLDRRQIQNWITGLPDESYRTAIELLVPAEDIKAEIEAEATDQEKLLRSIWSRAINVPESRISIRSSSFLKIGGDSISAMQVISACRSMKLSIRIQDILKGKTIAQIADMQTTLKPNQPTIGFQLEEKTKELMSTNDKKDSQQVMYDLGPIQSLFMQHSPGENLFNQSFLVDIALSGNGRRIGKDELTSALHALVSKHSMLRGRFRFVQGRWKQTICSSIKDAYRLRSWGTDDGKNHVDMAQKTEEAAQLLDLEHGPVFAAEFFASKRQQVLYLVAHHMVIDLVSWRIILQDLEDYLLTGKMDDIEGTPFPQWCTTLSTYRKEYLSMLPPGELLPFNVQPSDYEYWSMKYESNLMQDVVTESFTLDRNLTAFILNEFSTGINTEPLDILMAAVMHSFAKVFPDRDLPPIYNEGHGRQPWDDSVEIFSTVGWFTIIYPVLVEINKDRDDIFDTIERLKDVRRLIPSKGFSYFGSLDFENSSFTTEICFNFHGLFQQLERQDGLFTQLPWESVGINPTSVNATTRRISLIDINVGGTEEGLQFVFAFNKKTRHQERIKEWIYTCQLTLERMKNPHGNHTSRHNLSDFPCLKPDFDLIKLQNITLPAIGLSGSDIEDIYPLLPMQQGILLSQAKDSSIYCFRTVVEIYSRSKEANIFVDCKRLALAWQEVVQHHGILRTIFLDTHAKDGIYDQIVLRKVTPTVRITHGDIPSGFAAIPGFLESFSHENGDDTPSRPDHTFSIFQDNTTKRVFCSLEVNHALLDGTSKTLLLQDLCLAYGTRLPAARNNFLSHYILHLQSQSPHEALNYWKNYLLNITPCLLPTSGNGLSQSGLKRLNVLPFGRHGSEESASCEIRNICQLHGLTPFHFFRAIWALTLRAYVDMELDQVCFGVVTSGRDMPLEGIATALIPLSNILASKVKIERTSRFLHIVRAIQEDWIDSLEFQTCPQAEIQHSLQSGPLFNTGITLQKSQHILLEHAGEEEISFNIIGGNDPTEYDLVVHVMDDNGEFGVHFSYWGSRITESQATNISHTFAKIFSQVIQDPMLMANELELVSKRDTQQIWAWNSGLPPTLETLIDDAIVEMGTKCPESQAVCSTETTITYKELDRLSSWFAEFYLSHLGPESYVLVYSEKSVWVVISALGILKAGCVIALVEPPQPSERLQTILATLGPMLILSSPTYAETCRDQSGASVIEISPQFYSQSTTRIPSRTKVGISKRTRRPNDAAYVVFTSGSTGTPKASVTEHAAFYSAFKGYHSGMGLDYGIRALQFASYNFDASILQILGTLIVGGCICIPSNTERVNDLSSFINRLNVTWIQLTPTVASLLKPEEIPSVRCVCLCGEAMAPADLAMWAQTVRLTNGFGPSECSVCCSVEPYMRLDSDTRSIGRGLGSVLWIVDQNNHCRLVPIGCVGELLIEGPGLARGYLKQKALTEAAFIKRPPWAPVGRAKRLYKTGDLVKYETNGTLRFIGRKDKQIKIRGQRVELGEIEHHLENFLPKHIRSAADVVTTSEGAKLLVVFLCEEKTLTQADISDLQHHLIRQLPSFMVPSGYIGLDQMPLMASGKLDRKALRSLGATMKTKDITSTLNRSDRLLDQPDQLDRSFQPDQSDHLGSPVEEKLRHLWKDVLMQAGDFSGDDINIHPEDNFFELGGDSLLAMKLAAVARSQDIQLTVSMIFRYPSLSTMAHMVSSSLVWDKLAEYSTENTSRDSHSEKTGLGTDETDNSTSLSPSAFLELKENIELNEPADNRSLFQKAADLCAVALENIEDVYPCTPLQESLFALSMKRSGAYIAKFALPLPKELDISRYQRAWEQVFKATPILRTRILGVIADHESNERSFQAVVQSHVSWDYGTDLQTYIDDMDSMGFGDPLVQFAIIRECETNYLVLTAHHAVYDGSLSIVLDHVRRAYSDEIIPKTAPFRDFVEFLDSINKSDCDTFWLSYLHGTPKSHFAQSSTKSTTDTEICLQKIISIPSRRRPNVTVATIIRTAWALVLANHMKSNDIVFGETLSGRNAPIAGVLDIVGPLLTTVPVRIKINQRSSVLELLQKTQEQMTNMIPYEQAGIRYISLLSPETKAACAVSCLLVIHHQASLQTGIGFEMRNAKELSRTPISYPISMEFVQGDGEISIHATFDSSLVDQNQMLSMLDNFNAISQQIFAEPAARISEVQRLKSNSLVHHLPTKKPQRVETRNASREILVSGSGSVEKSKMSVKDTQEILQGLFSKIFGTKSQVGSDDDFVSLGGDSITAMRLVSLAKASKILLTVGGIFEFRTPRKLSIDASYEPSSKQVAGQPQQDAQPFATLIHSGVDIEFITQAACSRFSVFEEDIEDIYPATDYQIWALSHGVSKSRGNSNYFLFHLNGELDTARMERTCRSVVANHPLLRTVFFTRKRQVLQVVLKALYVEFSRHIYDSKKEKCTVDDFVHDLISQDINRPVSIADAIVRFKLVKRSKLHHVLVMRASHCQYDGVSFPIIMDELKAAYLEQPLAVHATYSAFVAAVMERQEESLDYWRQKLLGSSMTEIIGNYAPPSQSIRQGMIERSLPALHTSIEGITVASIVKAAWAYVLSELSGKTDIVFGQLVSGRNLPIDGIETLSGACINYIPMRVTFAHLKTIGDLLGFVQKELILSIPHETLGFRKMIEKCTDWRRGTRFSSILQHENVDNEVEFKKPSMMGSVEWVTSVFGPSYDSCDISIKSMSANNVLKIQISFNSSVLPAIFVETILQKLCDTIGLLSSSANSSPLTTGGSAPLIPYSELDPRYQEGIKIVESIWETLLEQQVGNDTPFFDLWGEEIAAYCFAEEMGRAGITATCEDMLRCCTKRLQIEFIQGKLGETSLSK